MDILTFRIFASLTGMATLIMLFSFVSHNSWAVATLSWFAVHTIVYWYMGRPGNRSKRIVGRLKLGWTILSVILAIAFVSQYRPPLTTVVVNVKDAPAPSQLQLASVTLDQNDKESITHASRVFPSVSAKAGISSATFLLIVPIKEEIQRLELRFGDHPYEWKLESIEVGSDFARIPIPVATWSGTDVATSRYMRPLMTQTTPDSTTGHVTLKVDAIESRRAKRPALRLNLSRAIVVKQSKGARYELLRAGWLVVLLLTLAMATRVPNFGGLVKRLGLKLPTQGLLGYLNGSSRDPLP